MTDSRKPLLIVEDDPALQKQMRWAFDAYETVVASDRESAVAQMRRFEPAVVTMDLGLPPSPDDPSEGLKLLEEIHTLVPETKVVVLTGQNDQAIALRAIALGAYDFCTKPFEPELLTWTIERAFRLHELQEENRRLQAAQQLPALGGIVTRDPAMQRVCRTIEKVAPTSATVLILGESGTGKELFARAVHDLSPRAGNRFVAINCAAIPENLLESELFGHEKGAFTGAVKQTPGKIETAHGGTLFLDEIGELDLALQAKLVRVLDTRKLRRLGGREEIPLDVHLVAATNRDLAAEVRAGNFRADLYYRLDVVRIELPPLRDREDDGWTLAQEFLKEAARRLGRGPLRLPPHLKREFLAYTWPGNVREVRNHMERLALVAPPGTQDVLDLDLPKASGNSSGLSIDFRGGPIPWETIEREAIMGALDAAQGNVSEAARLLGLGRGALRYRMARLGAKEEPEEAPRKAA